MKVKLKYDDTDYELLSTFEENGQLIYRARNRETQTIVEAPAHHFEDISRNLSEL